MNLRLIELCAGGGGVAAGAHRCGIDSILAVECDPKQELLSSKIREAYSDNFPHVKMVAEVVQKAANFKMPEAEILWASPPCVNYSSANKGGKEKDADVEIAKAVSKIIKKVSPKFFFLENVRAYWGTEACMALMTNLLSLGYTVKRDIIDFSEYGLPQERIRLLISATKNCEDMVSLPKKIPKVGWKKALTPQLDRLRNGQPTQRQIKAGLPCGYAWGHSTGWGAGKFREGSRPIPTLTASLFGDKKLGERTKYARIFTPNGGVKIPDLECARILQGFPVTYKFPNQFAVAGAIIGNSVPPLFVSQLFNQIGA